MQGVIALLLGSAGGLLVWAVLAQQKVSKLRSKYAPITNAEEEAERIRKRSSVLQEQSKKTADSIVAKGQAKLKHLEQEAESIREALSNNPVRSGVGFDLPEVSSFSLDRVPLGPDSVDSR
jgi:predicted nuclease with TOPRIM domain